MIYLYPIWLFFAALFFYFGYVHWRQSNEELRPFQFRERDTNPGGERPALDQANVEFVRDFNNYLEKINSHNRSRNRAAAVGYFVAGVVALISMAILLFG